MLRALDIRDMLIIDRLELELQPGLNVLTGETGAGKSILLDCLGFVLGWRGRAELVRAGQAQGSVTASFDLGPGHPARDVLEAAGLPVRDELILRRVNTADGRKSAWVNDTRASGEVLRALSAALVELHGQQDDKGLRAAPGHRALLDTYADADGPRAAVRRAWRAWRDAQASLATARTRVAALAEEEEFLRHAVSEIDALAPVAGEMADLEEARRLMKAARDLGETVAAARAGIGEDAAGRLLRDALRGLEGTADRAEGVLDGALDALARAIDALSDAEREVDAAADRLTFDPGALERTEDRFHALRGLARKHQVSEDELAALGERLRGDLRALDAGEADLADLERAAAQAERSYDEASEALTALRRKAADALDRAMATELAPLKLERAVFTTAIRPDAAGPEGRDAVEFTVATNPGAPAGPLGKIASGGELSRFLLALKVCLHGGDGGRTMIFDEIDRGVGGATADAVGRRLARLSEEAQVLVVTHSPQVAARGRHHLRVEKAIADEMTLSRVSALGAEDRVDEVARMLAGDVVTEEARAAARALLRPAKTL
ncbi:MAG: DNA repair protein RecN [Pseudomonadota bacterium]